MINSVNDIFKTGKLKAKNKKDDNRLSTENKNKNTIFSL